MAVQILTTVPRIRVILPAFAVLRGSWHWVSFHIVHFVIGRGIAQDSHRETDIRDIHLNKEMVALDSSSQAVLTQQCIRDRELRALSKVHEEKGKCRQSAGSHLGPGSRPPPPWLTAVLPGKSRLASQVGPDR